MKRYFMGELQGHIAVETMDQFIARGVAFQKSLKSLVSQAAQQSSNADETVLVVTHSRMINVLLNALTKDKDTGRYQYGVHTGLAQVFFTDF